MNTDPASLATELLISADGSRRTTFPDGTVRTLTKTPDPRFGMSAPVLGTIDITTPGGRHYQASQTRSATLTDPTNPLSLIAARDTTVINDLFTIVRDYAQSGSDRTITETSAALRHRYLTLDASGRVLSTELEGFYPVRFDYDATTGLLRSIKQGTPGPDGDERVYNLNYDTALRLASIVNPASQAVSFPSYDAADRLLTQVLPDANQVGFTYDANGNLATLTPPGRPAHGFEYTPIDLEQKYLPPAVPGVVPKDTTSTYNFDRQLDLVSRPDGQSVDYVYDNDIPGVATGRLRKVTLPEGDVTYDYVPATAPSGAGRVASITRPDGGTISYGYDGFLLTDTTWGCASPPCAPGTVLGRVAHAYDDNLRVSSETVSDPTGLVFSDTVTFGYDSDGLLTSAGGLTITRDAPPQKAGLIATTALGGTGGVTDHRTYDSFGELKTYSAVYGGTTPLLDVIYDQRDGLGRIVDKTESILGGAPDVYHYEYDAVGRLTKVTKNGMDRSYHYDANGNRTAAPNLVGIATYDDQDRLTRYGPADHTFEYTNNGDLLAEHVGSSSTTFQYDAAGNLRTVHLPDGRQIDYVVDGQNRRVGKKVNGTLVQAFLYSDQLRIIAELDGGGQIVSRFLYAESPNVPDYMVRDGITYRLVTDHLGSVRLVVAIDGPSIGAVAQRTDYDEFGVATDVSGGGFQPFGFAGGLYDRDTHLVRFGARDYHAQIARWTAKDPSRFRADRNLFAYALNDPVNLTDPRGLSAAGVLVPAIELVIDFARIGLYGLLGGVALTCSGDNTPPSHDCNEVISDCRAQCIDTYVKDPHSLPGSGTDSVGRIRRCIRECAEARGCHAF
ncbi:RHS repeat protein [Candidatus Binatia bacterium]|nr:RHS repeat protein [Candidatus Binatia bacterium]